MDVTCAFMRCSPGGESHSD